MWYFTIHLDNIESKYTPEFARLSLLFCPYKTAVHQRYDYVNPFSVLLLRKRHIRCATGHSDWASSVPYVH